LILPADSQTLAPMTAFRADPIEISARATSIENSEPFSMLAEAARHVTVPATPSATSAAIERLKHRLVHDLTVHATATGSLGRATRSAAEGYRGVEASISRRAGG
jgi:hypothetical protein